MHFDDYYLCILFFVKKIRILNILLMKKINSSAPSSPYPTHTHMYTVHTSRAHRGNGFGQVYEVDVLGYLIRTDFVSYSLQFTVGFYRTKAHKKLTPDKQSLFFHCF